MKRTNPAQAKGAVKPGRNTPTMSADTRSDTPTSIKRPGRRDHALPPSDWAVWSQTSLRRLV